MLKKILTLMTLSSIYITPISSALPFWEALVTNAFSQNVTPVNLNTNTTGANLVFPFNVSDVIISNDANMAYVASADGSTTVVTPINLNTNTLGPDIQIAATGSTFAVHLALTPNGQKLYALIPITGEVVPIDLNTNVAGTPLVVGGSTFVSNLFITPDGSKAYVCCTNPMSLVPIDVATDTVLPSIPLTFAPFGPGVVPDGSSAYITAALEGNVYPFDLGTETQGAAIPVGTSPVILSIAPGGQSAYVSNGGSAFVTPIDLTTNAPEANIPAGMGTSLSVTPDGALVYVCESFNNTVAIIDVATASVIPPSITPFSLPFVIRITPDQAPTAAFTTTSPGEFDASASSSPVGSIQSYFWDFGDGNTEITTSSSISHDYATPGSYTVTLTVTNTGGTSTEFVYTGQMALRNGGPSAQTSQQIVIPSDAPTPASNLVGQRFKNKFLNETILINELKWSPSTDPTVTGYNLFRNGKLIAVIPAAGPYIYSDFNRKKKHIDTYVVTAFNANGGQSTPISFTFD